MECNFFQARKSGQDCALEHKDRFQRPIWTHKYLKWQQLYYFLAHFTLHQLTVHDFRMSLVNLNSKWPAARAIHKGARLIFVCDKHIPGSKTSLYNWLRPRENFFEFAFCLLLCILFVALSFTHLFAVLFQVSAKPNLNAAGSEQTKARNTPHRADDAAGNKNTSSTSARAASGDAIAITKSWRLCRVHNCAQSAPDTCTERKRNRKIALTGAFC